MIILPENLNKQWPVKSSRRPQLNETYNFYFTGDYNWFAEVVAFENNKTIQFLMTRADDGWTGTEVVFEIINKSKEVQILRFEHRGWQNINDHFRKTSYCWAFYFQKMKSLFETK